jgi:hypothetical protein
MLRGRVCLYQLCFPLYKGPLRAGLLRYGDVNSHLRGFLLAVTMKLMHRTKLLCFFCVRGLSVWVHCRCLRIVSPLLRSALVHVSSLPSLPILINAAIPLFVFAVVVAVGTPRCGRLVAASSHVVASSFNAMQAPCSPTCLVCSRQRQLLSRHLCAPHFVWYPTATQRLFYSSSVRNLLSAK